MLLIISTGVPDGGRTMSLDKHGSRVVQRALEVGDGDWRLLLAAQLKDHIFELYSSPHGNYVVQKLILVRPHQYPLHAPMLLFLSTFVGDWEAVRAAGLTRWGDLQPSCTFLLPMSASLAALAAKLWIPT